MEMVLMVGIPGCGKSTYARERLAGHLRISRDEMRGDPAEVDRLAWRYRREVHPKNKKPKKVRRAEYILVSDALRSGRDIVIDSTNTTRSKRELNIRLAKEHGARVRAVFFTDHEAAMERNARRIGKERVPDRSMRRILDNLEPPSAGEGIDEIIEQA